MNPSFVLGLIASVGTLFVVFELLRRRMLRGRFAVLWLTVAGVLLVLTVIPAAPRWLADLVGVEVPANLLFFLGLLLLLLTNIQQSVELGRLEEKTRVLAEELALLRLEVESVDGADPPE